MKAHLLSTPTPGAIALKCKTAGSATLTAVLGIGVVESDGTPDRDEHISDGYADLAADPNPARFVRDYWADQADEHPWLAEHLPPMLEHLRKPSPEQVEGVVKAAAYLATVKMSGAEEMAGADLLGRCYTEMVAIANRRARPGHSFDLAEGMLDSVFQGFAPQEGDRVADLWAASGMRCIGAATWMRSRKQDPQTVTWVMLEGDPLLRAIIGINAIAFELGDKIEILDGTEYKRALLAAKSRGTQSLVGGKVVDDSGLDVPGVLEHLSDTRG